ncbi:unnamed protein product [Closterium sp. NIES-53]
MSHLRSLDTRYRVALRPDFVARNQPPMYLTLYFLTTRSPDSFRIFQDHFLSLDPTELTLASRSVMRLVFEGGGAVEVVEMAVVVGVARVVEVVVTVGVVEVVEALRVPRVKDRAWVEVELMWVEV